MTPTLLQKCLTAATELTKSGNTNTAEVMKLWAVEAYRELKAREIIKATENKL